MARSGRSRRVSVPSRSSAGEDSGSRGGRRWRADPLHLSDSSAVGAADEELGHAFAGALLRRDPAVGHFLTRLGDRLNSDKLREIMMGGSLLLM